MPSVRWVPNGNVNQWAVTIDGVDTGVVISAPGGTPEQLVALQRIAELVKNGEGAEIYIEHFRAYSDATGARREMPAEALPKATKDALDEASAFIRELKAEAAKPVTPVQG